MRTAARTAIKKRKEPQFIIAPCEAEGKYLKKSNENEIKGIHLLMSSRGLFLYSFSLLWTSGGF